MADIYFHVYVSSAVRPFSEAELIQLLEGSRTRNEAAGVTGMLLYKDGNFMQVLEGPRPQVDVVLARIRRDERHRGILKLTDGYREGREFSDWSMAFANLNRPEVASTPGYSEFLSAPLTDIAFAENPTRAQKLLLTFRKVVR